MKRPPAARLADDPQDDFLAPLLAWAQGRLETRIGVPDLAEYAKSSPATLHRHFRARLGTTPLAWLNGQRLSLACRLLEEGELSLAAVARRSGLGTEGHLRALMRRETGFTPLEYQRHFGSESFS